MSRRWFVWMLCTVPAAALFTACTKKKEDSKSKPTKAGPGKGKKGQAKDL